MHNRKWIYLFLAILPSIHSCAYFHGQEKVPLAKVGNNVLYLSELQNKIPKGITEEDSILLSEDYIKRWINKGLLILKANENLTISQRDLAREMEEYRNSLIIFRYQNELMKEKLDTNVSEQEIDDYYLASEKDFIQNADLVKAIYVKIPLHVHRPERVMAFCESSSSQNLKELDEFCRKNSGVYRTYLDQWVEAGTLFQHLPSRPENLSSFLSRYSRWEFRDSGFFNLISIKDYSPAGSIAPVDYVRNEIKEIIVNKRKTEFLKKLEDDVFLEGIKNNKFIIYAHETD